MQRPVFRAFSPEDARSSLEGILKLSLSPSHGSCHMRAPRSFLPSASRRPSKVCHWVTEAPEEAVQGWGVGPGTAKGRRRRASHGQCRTAGNSPPSAWVVARGRRRKHQRLWLQSKQPFSRCGCCSFASAHPYTRHVHAQGRGRGARRASGGALSRSGSFRTRAGSRRPTSP